jgi:hypothetical protein
MDGKPGGVRKREFLNHLSCDDVGIGEVGAVFERFVFEPEPSRWEASETDGRGERPTELGNEGVKMSRLSLSRFVTSLTCLRAA